MPSMSTDTPVFKKASINFAFYRYWRSIYRKILLFSACIDRIRSIFKRFTDDRLSVSSDFCEKHRYWLWGKLVLIKKSRKAQYTASYHADQARSKRCSAPGDASPGRATTPAHRRAYLQKREQWTWACREQSERRGEQRALTNAHKKKAQSEAHVAVQQRQPKTVTASDTPTNNAVAEPTNEVHAELRVLPCLSPKALPVNVAHLSNKNIAHQTQAITHRRKKTAAQHYSTISIISYSQEKMNMKWQALSTHAHIEKSKTRSLQFLRKS